MKILWEVVKESKIFDPADVMGSVRIVGKDGEIFDDLVFLDIWFAILIEAVNRIENEDFFELDLIDEPNPLIVRKLGSFVSLKYGNQEIKETEISDFRKAVLLSGKRLIDFVEINTPEGNWQNWNVLKKWVENYS